jgi:hypothetical protein
MLELSRLKDKKRHVKHKNSSKNNKIKKDSESSKKLLNVFVSNKNFEKKSKRIIKIKLKY